MKMIWILLAIGLAVADKLDRAYLPPPGLTSSEGTLDFINIPLEPPKSKFNTVANIPELVIGINRVSPNEADTFDEDTYTHKPKIIHNDNSLSFTTEKPPSSVFKQPSLILQPEQDFTSIMPEVTYESDHQSIDFQNPQNNEEILKFDYKNRVYLASYGGNDKGMVPFITLPLPIMGKNDKDIVSDKYMPLLNMYNREMIPSTFPPNIKYDANRKIEPDHTQFSSTTPIKEDTPIFNKERYQRPERVQAQADRQATILNYEQSINPEGYNYNFDTSNAIQGDEQGTTLNGVKSKGSYSYVGDDGKLYQVEYTADENGFVPKGNHLPTAPPIPDAILKVIEQAARDREAGIYDDGSYNEEKYGYNKYHKLPHINHVVTEPNSHKDINLDDLHSSHKSEFIDIGSIKNHENIYSGGDNNKNHSPSKNIILDENNQKPSSKSDFVLDNTDQINLNLGYEYFPPQYSFSDKESDFQQFPSRFSGIENQNMQPIIIKENITDKVTAKPFLTPYVTRKDDDKGINDDVPNSKSEQKDIEYDESLNEDESEEQDKDIFSNVDDLLYGNKLKNLESNRDKPNSIPIDTNEETDSNEFFSEDKPGQQLQNEDDLFHPVSSTEDGYPYQNANKSMVTLAPRLSHIISTTARTKFPTISLDNYQSPNRSPSSLGTSFNTTSFEMSSSETPVSLQAIQSITSSAILDTKSTSMYPDAFSETDLSSTAIITHTSKPAPDLSLDVSLRLTTQSPLSSGQTIPEKYTIREDFSGPKQPQKFDPITGYYY